MLSFNFIEITFKGRTHFYVDEQIVDALTNYSTENVRYIHFLKERSTTDPRPLGLIQRLYIQKSEKKIVSILLYSYENLSTVNLFFNLYINRFHPIFYGTALFYNVFCSYNIICVRVMNFIQYRRLSKTELIVCFSSYMTIHNLTGLYTLYEYTLHAVVGLPIHTTVIRCPITKNFIIYLRSLISVVWPSLQSNSRLIVSRIQPPKQPFGNIWCVFLYKSIHTNISRYDIMYYIIRVLLYGISCVRGRWMQRRSLKT